MNAHRLTFMAGHAALLLALGTLPTTLAATTAADERSIPKLAPPYAEMPPTYWEQHDSAIIAVGIVLLALAALGVWLGLRRKPIEIVPPATQARNELQALQALPEDGAVLSKVSQVLRRYFMAFFSLPPGEFTTAELCRVISGNEQIGAELSSAVAAFLRDCDARKFSTVPVTPANAVSRALELVERGEAQRRPPPTAKAHDRRI
jgi:hypothetical protein